MLRRSPRSAVKPGSTKRMGKTRVIAAALAVGLAAAVVPAVAASAASQIDGYNKVCSGSVPYVQVQSTSTGGINHEANYIVLDHWNNGSTSQTRWSLTSYSTVYYWRAFLTGIGGDITYGNAVCHS